MKLFQSFHEVAKNPGAYATEWKKRKRGKVIGTFCSYAPEEIILAAGALGYRLFGKGAEISKADAHLQAYSCNLVRGALEESLAGELPFLDGVVFPHTCDSIQRLSDIWRLNIKTGFHLDLVMPVKLNTGSAKEYMIDVMKKFKTELEQVLKISIADDELAKAVETCNEIRSTMQKLYNLRSSSPGIIKGSDMHALVRAGMVMDRYEYLSAIQNLLKELEPLTSEKKSSQKRLVLAGGLCNMPDIYEAIEKAGAVVVADDLCTGSRFFEGQVENKDDLVSQMALRYAERNVCPAKHSGNRTRGESLVQLAKDNSADGVLYVFLKFCDPHGFDYPYLKEMLDEAGIPNLMYELEDQSQGGGQLETRCEAFVEML